MNQFQRIILQIAKILALFSPRPTLHHEFQDTDFRRRARRNFPDAIIKFWDSKYYTTNMEEWGKIFANVLLEMPAYISNKYDCDNFSFHTSALVSARFKLNTCGVASGHNANGQAHAFNVFLAVGRFHILEPQTGEVDPVGYTIGHIDFF